MALRCRIRFSPESIRGAVTVETVYTFVLDESGNLNVPYLNCNVAHPYVNWNNLGNDWDDYGLALLRATLFISLPFTFCLVAKAIRESFV